MVLKEVTFLTIPCPWHKNKPAIEVNKSPKCHIGKIKFCEILNDKVSAHPTFTLLRMSTNLMPQIRRVLTIHLTLHMI
jgi:hypothetical protein